MVFLRGWAALAAAAAIVWTAAAGCSSGLSESDAALRCGQDQTALSACYSATVLASCESCFEQCGDDCAMIATCPITYTCGAGTTTTTGTGGSGGSASASSSSTGQ